jgi:hypothetical protein
LFAISDQKSKDKSLTFGSRGSHFNLYISNQALTLNEWQHLTVTFNSTLASFFLNGQLVSTTINDDKLDQTYLDPFGQY